MHDEFSAILRTYYNNFADLIEIGVKQNDSHPAGVQVFIYYWIKLFGLSEAILKFPFILLGTSSVYLIYLIGKQWFGKTSGLLAASVFAVMQFGVFYSQLARPYSPGLFFVLLSTYFWTKFVFEENHNKWLVVAYVLAAVSASYSHMFSLLFVVVQGVSGLFFLKKSYFLKYIFVNTAVFLLYIPNMSIFYAQLSRGDIGGWLSDPSVWFLVEFLFYTSHFSYLFSAAIILIAVLLPFFSVSKKEGINKFRYLAIIWFFTSYLIAYLYSVLRFPIIQFSTLLFVFPFLLLFSFSFVGSLKISLKYLIIIIVSVIGVQSLVVNRQHYNVMYTQGFDGIPREIVKYLKETDNRPHKVIMQAPNHKMFEYYFEKSGVDTNYLHLDKPFDADSISNYLRNDDQEDLLFGWVDYSRLEYLEFLKDRYKYIVSQRQFFNSEYYRFSNTTKGEHSSDSRKFIATTGIKSDKLLMKSNAPGYSKGIEIGLDTITLNKFDVINLRAEIDSADKNADALLVFDLRDKNGDVVSWSASKLSDYYLDDYSGHGGFFVYHSKRLLSFYPLSEGLVLKTYIWKRDSTSLAVKNLDVYLTSINPIENGLYDNIP